MTPAAVDSPRWTCAKCAVSVGRIDGQPQTRPETWTESEDGPLCLVCSRTMAAEDALDSASSDSTREDRARIRRTALIEFELRRTPDALDSSVAHACRTSTGAVAAVRLAAEKPEPAPAGGSDRRAGG